MTNEEMAQHKLVLVMTKKEVTNLLSEVIRYAFAEIVTNTKIICDNCGWSWNKADGGDDLYICHKCNHNNTPNALENFKDGKKKGKSKRWRKRKDVPLVCEHERGKEIITIYLYKYIKTFTNDL